ncbi:MAG: chromosomal replication initiator protein DnaA [Patescibacteria group bacterium]|nr:chromosomal replication initiator protein DnaA [Patescibacteria group bacterium]
MLDRFWNGFLNFYQKSFPEKNSLLLSFLKQIKPLEISGKKIFLGCPNSGIKFYLEKKAFLIEKLLYNFEKRKIAIEFVVLPPKIKKTSSPLLDFQPSTNDVLSMAGISSSYSFENFAVSSTNQVAFAAAQAVVNSPGKSYNPLFLYGGVGVGKTHLAQAIGRKILENDKKKKVLFSPGDLFINELIEAIKEKNTVNFRKKYRRLNLLIVDDIQFIAGKQAVQEEFFHTFNSIVSAGGQIILTSDRPPSEIKNLEDRLRSRFSGGLIIDIQPPDFELRCAILLIKANERKINIDIEAVKVIAEEVTDTRSLEGTLLSIYAKNLNNNTGVSLEVVLDYFSKNKKNQIKKISPNDVVKMVCSYYNIKQSQIKNETRESYVVLPRQLIMYILRTALGLKLSQIAYFLNRKDHTTIIHGIKKINRLLIKDPLFKQEVEKIISSFRLST